LLLLNILSLLYCRQFQLHNAQQMKPILTRQIAVPKHASGMKCDTRQK